jgi:hypothetical protein
MLTLTATHMDSNGEITKNPKNKKNIFFNKMWFPKSIQTKKIEMISKKYLKPFSVKRKLDRCSIVDA